MTLLNYKSEVSPERLAADERQEKARQELTRGEATAGALAYARFLSAIENDATLSHGSFKKFAPDRDGEIVRKWPFLAPLL